jgi:ABC-type transport system involved in multi-copper enzyme maturation permease subunit
VGNEADRQSVRFEPLRPASRGRLVAGLILGPIMWLVALAVAAWLFAYGWAIQLGLVITIASFVLAFVFLAVLRRGRVREERRYVDRG